MRFTLIIFCFISLKCLSQTGYDTVLKKYEYDDYSNKPIIYSYSFKFAVKEPIINFRKQPTIDVLPKFKISGIKIQDTSLPNNNSTTSNLKNYKETTDKATALYFKKDYMHAIELFEKAFKENNGLGQVIHRYRAACCYAILADLNNALIQLEKLSTKGRYFNLKEIESENAFNVLHNADRWKTIIQNVKNNIKIKLDELNSEIDDK